MSELEKWIDQELKSKDMKKFNRKKAHKKYLEKRIIELRRMIFTSLFYENNKELDEGVKILKKLFYKYNERLRKFK